MAHFAVAIVNLDLQEENERNLKLLNMGSHTSQKVCFEGTFWLLNAFLVYFFEEGEV